MKLIDIYELAWSKPINEISNEYDISYSNFKKLCGENSIPLPYLGYWSKIRFGKVVKKLDLPKDLDINKEIKITDFNPNIPKRPSCPVLPRRNEIHLLVKKTASYLKKSEVKMARNKHLLLNTN